MVYDNKQSPRIDRLEKQVAALTAGLETLRDVIAKETGTRPCEILDINSFDY